MSSEFHCRGPTPASFLQSNRSFGRALYCTDSTPVGQEFHDLQEIMVLDKALWSGNANPQPEWVSVPVRTKLVIPGWKGVSVVNFPPAFQWPSVPLFGKINIRLLAQSLGNALFSSEPSTLRMLEHAPKSGEGRVSDNPAYLGHVFLSTLLSPND